MIINMKTKMFISLSVSVYRASVTISWVFLALFPPVLRPEHDEFVWRSSPQHTSLCRSCPIKLKWNEAVWVLWYLLLWLYCVCSFQCLNNPNWIRRPSPVRPVWTKTPVNLSETLSLLNRVRDFMRCATSNANAMMFNSKWRTCFAFSHPSPDSSGFHWLSLSAW